MERNPEAAKRQPSIPHNPEFYAAELIRDILMIEKIAQQNPAYAELDLIARGFSREETAVLTGISETEVDNRLAECRQNLNAVTTAQAVAIAIENGDISLPAEENRPTLEAPLSDKEMEVLQLARLGDDLADTADKMHVSIQSVKDHRRGAFRKLGVKNIASAIYEAYSAGVLAGKAD